MNVCRTESGINPASSGTISKYDAMRSIGRKPQRAENGVRAIAISGLWFPSSCNVSERGEGCFFVRTFVDVGLFGMQFLRGGLIWMRLYA